MKDLEKSHADSAARSYESYMKDLEKIRNDVLHRAVRHRRRKQILLGGAKLFCYFAICILTH